MPEVSFKTIDSVDVAGKRVLVRVDLNVPMKNGQVTDATRIDQLNAWMPEADTVRQHFCSSGGAATGQP